MAADSLLAIIVPWRGLSDLRPALIALTGLNVDILRRHPLPPLYESGVKYQREKRLADGSTREQWLTAPIAYMRKVADCEDLASWRAAELRLTGIEANAMPRESSSGYHIVVVYPDGTIEDPSRKLGM